jgi:hypothetical protein
VDEQSNGDGVSPKRLEANRRNAQLSTGPKTEEGKNHSRCNARKHGVLASALLIKEGEGAENAAEYEELLHELRQDREPVGAVEEMLVEDMAVCRWRWKRALLCEAGLVRRNFARDLMDTAFENPECVQITDHLSLPLGPALDSILRYETTIQRKLVYAMNQLERLQRARKGEHVPAPVSVQVSGDPL